MTPQGLPFSAAAERNSEPLLAVLRQLLAGRQTVLEIGSGTGQHAVHFARALPHLTWQTSDLDSNLPALNCVLGHAGLGNTPAPLAGDVNAGLPTNAFDTLFTANTLHIMAWDEVEKLFAALAGLKSARLLVIYGPFNYGGHFTSVGNAAFDSSLREADPRRGIRDFEAVNTLAVQAGYQLREDRAMPANNRCISWERV